MSAASSTASGDSTSITAGLGIAAAGVVVGLAAPKLIQKLLSVVKPGGAFSGVKMNIFKLTFTGLDPQWH